MLKANELRIGNFIFWNSKLSSPEISFLTFPVEVTSILPGTIGYISPGIEHRSESFEDDKLQTQTTHKPLEEFEPILLTRDILEKCGFENTDVNDQYYSYRKESLTIRFMTGDSTRAKIGDCEFVCQYLHQLQNLYFDLTGEELEVAY
jgi:hypothetical protein